ncbi:MAG TPA: DegV family protein [Thermoanaerobaculia bacterium]|nr:DegV family protein [Thermoanaerobaculia bacterium]
MPRPAVLVVDPEPVRRKGLSRGLTGFGYDVIPAVDEREGRRFAEGLGPGVVVAPVELAGFGDASILARFSMADPASQRTLLLLGRNQDASAELPEEVLYLDADGLPEAELVDRVHLVLLGREVGLEPDASLESLVGDFSLLPILELLRDLGRARVSGRLVMAEGEIVLADGAVVMAAAGAARGVKAFCRLSLLDAGPFWVQLRPAPAAAPDPGLAQDLKSLILLALEDRVHDAPDPRTRVRLQVGKSFFETRFNPRQREILTLLPGCATVGRLLDALPAATDGEILRDLLGLAELGSVTLEEPSSLVRVITDSTSDLPPDLARAHGIHVVPLQVLFGEEVFHDGVDLKPREFYERLEAGKAHPRSSPPPQADFANVYRDLAARKDVISLHLSGKLSQTVVHAKAAAAEELPDLQRQRGEEPVALYVIDSGSVSLGLGLLALFAARMARRGVEAGGIAERLAAMSRRLHVLFAVDTLDYLARGGRIGKGRALLGNLLGIKPILGVVDGEVTAVDRVRGGRGVQPRLIELLRERVDPARPVVVSIAHAKAPVWADRLRGLMEKSFRVEERIVGEMGPVVGTHAGPGTVGTAIFQPTADELPLIAPLEETA